jgi:hypothetical protein
MDGALGLLNEEFTAKVAALDVAQTQMRPAARPEAWTVQQIAEHLMLTYAMTVKAMDARLEKGTPTKAKATLANRSAQLLVAGLGYFPRGRIAPEIVRPVGLPVRSGMQLCEAFAAALQTMDGRFCEVGRVLGSGRCVSHMILGPMTIPQWRRFHLVHGRHHLKQIAAILQA